jgi:1-Cys peroxiredoxin 6
MSQEGAVQKSTDDTQWKLKLGAEVPNFDCETTHGNFMFHDFVSAGPKFTLLFSHPKDFTPVCTTELGRSEVRNPDFQARGVQLIGVSCDPVDSHAAWSIDILAREQLQKPDDKLSFPIIADSKREIVSKLGMLDPEELDDEGIPLPARALMIIDREQKKVKLAIVYPATTGRNFDELIRVVDSLTLTMEKSLATPVDWNQGERCIVAPNVPTDEAEQRFEDLVIEALPSGKQYLRHVKCPPMAPQVTSR